MACRGGAQVGFECGGHLGVDSRGGGLHHQGAVGRAVGADHILDGAGCEHSAARYDADRVGEAYDVIHQMGGEHDGGSGVGETADQLPNPAADRWIHPCRGLVQEDQVRAADDRESEGEALTLATGEASHEGAGEGVDAQVLRHLLDVQGRGMEARAVAQQLHRPGARGESSVLDHDPHPGSMLRARAPGVHAQHPHAAAVGAQQAGGAGDGGGLAGAVASQQRGDGAALGGQREPVQRADGAVADGEVVGDEGGGMGVHGAAHRRPRRA